MERELWCKWNGVCQGQMWPWERTSFSDSTGMLERTLDSPGSRIEHSEDSSEQGAERALLVFGMHVEVATAFMSKPGSIRGKQMVTLFVGISSYVDLFPSVFYMNFKVFMSFQLTLKKQKFSPVSYQIFTLSSNMKCLYLFRLDLPQAQNPAGERRGLWRISPLFLHSISIP